MKQNSFLNIEREKYHATQRIGSSDLKLLSQTAWHYHYAKNYASDEKTKSMNFGSEFEKYFWTWPDVKQKIVSMPHLDMRTKFGKEETKKINDQYPDSEGWIKLPHDFYHAIRTSCDAVWRETEILPFLLQSPLLIEQSVFFEWQGVECKARFDAVSMPVDFQKKGFIIDLKTSTEYSLDGFQRSLIKFGYHIQAAHYQNAMREAFGEEYPFHFLVVQNKPPYAFNYFISDESVYAAGNKVITKALDKYKRAKDTGNWTCFNGVTPLAVDHWTMQKLEIDDD